MSPESNDTANNRPKEKSDSTINVKDTAPSDCEVLVQKVINRYSKAKGVKEKTVPQAVKKVESYHTEIKELMHDLCEKLQSEPILKKAEAIERLVDKELTWKVSATCQPTPLALKLMDEQIKRLNELKTAIKEGNKE